MEEATRLTQTWEASLPLDEDGDVIYPNQGEPGFTFTPGQSFIRDFSDSLKSLRKDFVRYKHEQDQSGRYKLEN